jgi:hypothetical protein
MNAGGLSPAGCHVRPDCLDAAHRAVQRAGLKKYGVENTALM